ncbi:retrovirus-related pol polyprotein from transposon TNT 1-94 [Tanacetum coccineum]
MSEFCEKKGIKKEFSVARTPQQNGVAERRNKTLIEAARTMLVDSKLPTIVWAEAVNTACYVQNRVLVVKTHKKTLYELFRGRTPSLSFMRPFGCHVTILNTLDYLGKFDGKSDKGFFFRYSLNSKAFRVSNIRTRKVEESLHIRFLEDKPIIAGDGPKWLFDIDILTKSMNYVPVVTDTNSNDFAGTEESIGAGHSARRKTLLVRIILSVIALFHVLEEPKKVIQALKDPSWKMLCKEKSCLQFQATKGYTQEDGIDYDEVFSLVVRIEAIRLFLAYASFKDFVVYQMDVKSSFLYGKIEEEFYVCQPLGFEDLEFYGTEFILYVDDIIFGSTKKELCTEFKKLMHKKFQMSSMGGLTFLLRTTIRKKKDDGIFISQDKYMELEILKKFGFSTVKTTSTPMETSKPLMKDENAEDVDVHLYRSMIDQLMYLTSSKA